MEKRQAQIELLQLLLSRLARISADSPWAYKASGLRGSLLRCVEQLEAAGPQARLAQGRPLNSGEQVLEQLDWLITYGFEILEKAARK
jgi:hypothetical protein